MDQAPLSRLAELHGVATSYSPSPGRTVQVADAAVVAVLAALGVDASTPEAVRNALTVRETELITRLLPPTVVWWQDGEPAGLADLPPGTRLSVETEQGGRHDWTVAQEPALRQPEADRGPAPPAPAPGRVPGPDEGQDGGWGEVRDEVRDEGRAARAEGRAPGGAASGAGRQPGHAVLGDVTPGDAAPRLPPGVHALTATAPDRRTARVHLVVAPARMPDPCAAPAARAAPSARAASPLDASDAPDDVPLPEARACEARTSESGPPGHRPPEARPAGFRPAAPRVHGLLVQLYSVLSERSWGMGDLGDLAELASWACRSCGAGFVQVNPLHCGMPGECGDPSPYRPASRYVPDPVHLRVEDVPEYAYLDDEARAEAAGLAARAAQLREGVLRDGALIDRDAVRTLKRRALELAGRVPLGPGRRAAYADFLADAGQALEDHATWSALAEVHGPDWTRWPAELRDPRSAGTARARRELLDRVDFHSRLAWLTDGQLAAAQRAARDAGMPIGIVHDLAVGVHPAGADAWAQQDFLARDTSLGAPPDTFNPRGQDWSLPPWRPDRLAASGYAPYRRLLRSLFRHAGGLRIDHVMGLFRLWWIPQGQEPTGGTYVRYDAEAMLAVLALEAHRANALVIGEDLGTVAPGVRETLRAHGVLGTSVLWFERGAAASADADTDAPDTDTDTDADASDTAGAGTGQPLPPERWRSDCLATLTTHDLPPTAARLTGAHVMLRHRLGLLARPLEEEWNAATTETAEWLELLARLGLLFEDTDDGVHEHPPEASVRHEPPAHAGAFGAAENPETFQYTGEEERIRALYRFLLRTPARLIGVWLPDAVGDRRPQNVPGTWRAYPNWRLPVADAEGRPLTLEQLAAAPRLHGLLDTVREAH